jgi:hypothetical protein
MAALRIREQRYDAGPEKGMNGNLSPNVFLWDKNN